MNKFFDQFAKQPLVVKIGLLGVVLVIMSVVYYQVWYVPKKQQIKNLDKKRNDLKAKLVVNRSVADNLPKFQEEVNILNEQLKQAISLLPNEANVHEILRQVSILAKKTSVDLLFFRPLGSAKHGFYSSKGIDLKLQGTYHDIAGFLDQIGKLNRIINVSDIVFSGVTRKANSIVLKVDVKAKTFMFQGRR